MRSSPSFQGLCSASKAASRAKQGNRRTDTKPEIEFRRALWQRGLRYRKNVSSLPGKPDIVFRGPRVVVFCDGDFWHGRDWHQLRRKLARRNNPEYWIAKISSNRERDRRTDRVLAEEGWRVVRLWEGEILKDPAGLARHVEKIVRERNLGRSEHD